MNNQIIAVTGANGFVGRVLCDQLRSQGFGVRRLMRSTSGSDTNVIQTGDINPKTDWSTALDGISTVIHCAARAHVMNDLATDSLAAYRSVNVGGTRRLAEQAVACGVKRLVFLSSVKVNGEKTEVGKPFLSPGLPSTRNGWTKQSPFQTPVPEDDYGISKWEAEQALWQVAQQTGLEVVVVRSPLVYGPGVRANFLRLMRMVQRGWLLPFGLVNNRRSMVALDNLVDLLIRCVESPKASRQTFMVSDGQDLSTPQLVRGLARVMGVPARLVPVPHWMLRLGGKLIGRQEEIERLIGSLQVDISHTCATLDWKPPISVEDGLRRAAEWFVREHGVHSGG
jgi:nucleoside-diphosphate-sugar epimerase